MKYMERTKFKIILLFYGLMVSQAHGTVTALKQEPVTRLTISVKDKSLINKPLILILKEDEINHNVGAKKIEANADENGLFKFVIPGLRNIARFSLYFPKHSILGEQFLEPGDDIIIKYNGGLNIEPQLSADRLLFSGKGHIKFDVLKQISVSEPDISRLIDTTSFGFQYLEEFLELQDAICKFKMRILNHYKQKLNFEIFQIIRADIFGKSYTPYFLHVSQLYKDPSKRNVIRSFYNRTNHINFTGDYTFASKSAVYVQYFLLSKMKTNALINSVDGNVTPKDIFTEIIKLNNSKLREKLLMCYLLRLSKTIASTKSEDALNLSEMNSVLKYITSRSYKQLIKRLYKSRTKGSQAYVFTLPDTAGKMVSLRDFKDKVVLIDCWFTGCTNCVDVAKIIDNQILPKFLKDTNIVFISINVDRERTTWKKSVKSGKYTNSKSINLYTEGLELDHPFIKNYYFQGFPHVMLVDKNGKIFSAEMPRDGDQMIAIINEALKDISNKNEEKKILF